MDFLNVLRGFRSSSQLAGIYDPHISALSSSALRRIVTGNDDGGVWSCACHVTCSDQPFFDRELPRHEPTVGLL